MSACTSRERTRTTDTVQKAQGIFHRRVQKVGPEHFGIVTVDCTKARSKWMPADFYGNALVPPTPLQDTRTAFAEAN